MPVILLVCINWDFCCTRFPKGLWVLFVILYAPIGALLTILRTCMSLQAVLLLLLFPEGMLKRYVQQKFLGAVFHQKAPLLISNHKFQPHTLVQLQCSHSRAGEPGNEATRILAKPCFPRVGLPKYDVANRWHVVYQVDIYARILSLLQIYAEDIFRSSWNYCNYRGFSQERIKY